MNRDDEDKGKSCCTWPKVAVLVIVVAVGGILIWKFAPIDDVIDSVLPTFNNTGSNSGNPGVGNPSGPVPSPTLAPTPRERFQFNRCQDPTENCCNGLDTICDLGVDDVLYATVHNAMATFEDGFLFGPNHKFKLEDALEAGYRGINLDVCNCNGVYQFCHGVCNLGSRDVVEVFTSINTFLDDNPTELLAIPLELNSEADQPIDMYELYSLMQQVSGFTDKLYVHENVNADWPTLREAIDVNKRILMFHYRGPSCDEPNSCPPGLHWYHRYAIDTKWEFPTLADIRATSTSCSFTRNPGNASKTFFGVNNFVTPPAQASAKTVNEVEFAKNRIETCSQLNENLDVNFIYADFWSEGDLPRLTQEHNTELAARRRRNVRRSS